MHFVSEMSNLIANLIDLLACGVQFHRDDHRCPLCRRIFLCGEILSPDFSPPQKIPRNRREIVLRKIKKPLDCEWVGISFCCSAYRFAPRPLFRWNPKSKPLQEAVPHQRSIPYFLSLLSIPILFYI